MKPKVGLVLFEGVHIYVVPKTDYDALAARLASADIEATSLLMAMVQQWPDVHPDWKPLPDVAGKITQINNMVAGLRARLAEAERLLREVHTKHWPFMVDGLHERVYDFLNGAADSASGGAE